MSTDGTQTLKSYNIYAALCVNDMRRPESTNAHFEQKSPTAGKPKCSGVSTESQKERLPFTVGKRQSSS